MKTKNSAKSPTLVAKNRAAVENHEVAPDPKEKLRELQAQMKKLREDAKLAQQAHSATRVSERMEVTDRWIEIFETRLNNAMQRIEKTKKNLEILRARKAELESRRSERVAA